MPPQKSQKKTNDREEHISQRGIKNEDIYKLFGLGQKQSKNDWKKVVNPIIWELKLMKLHQAIPGQLDELMDIFCNFHAFTAAKLVQAKNISKKHH